SPQLDLASTVVNLGAAPAGTPGTTLGSATVAKLASSSDLLIRGYQAIEVFGDLAIGQRDPSSGQASLAKLTLDTPLLQGEGNADGTAGSASITAGVLTLRNTGGTATAAAGQGDLHLDVDTLDLGPGEVALAGYATLSGRAGAIEAEGAGGVSFGGSLSLATAQLRAGSGASYTIEVDGSVQLLSGPGLPEDPKKVGLGGTLAIASNSAVTLDTAVLVPAGTFAVTAGSGALHLGPNARVDVSGRAVEFSSDPEEPVTRFAPGGFIRLTAVAGDLDIDPQATLEVASGSPQGGDAGDIALTAGPQSTASVEGILLGAAGSGANRGGSFALDAGQVSDFGFLGALASGGFDQAVSLHLRGNQGITVASGQTLAAHEVVLRSDGGPVIVAGTVDAAGTALRPDGGSIELGGYAAPGQVGVLVSGTLDAHAGAAVQGGFAPESPQVEMVATGGSLTLAQGSLVDLRGGTDATGAALPGGALVLRAPRVGNDVALSPIAGTVRGASAIVVQGVDTETTDASGDADALVPGALASATAWLGNAPTILARLASADPSLASELSIGAGIVLENPAGDLTLADSVDLHGQLGPGYFGLVASGNVAIGNGTAMTLSDGFAAAAPGQTLGYELLGTPSASLGFEAGGDVALASNAVVRTGTGSISILAGRDVVLAPSAVLYSAGLATTPPPSFTGRTADAAGQTLYFPAQGGDISIEAGRNITSQLSPESTSAWLFRYGDASGQSAQPEQTSWSILYQNFEQGLGALGGGNVTVAAGGDIQELQVSIPTTGYLKTPAGMTPVASDLVVQGGGNLNLLAGGNLYGGLFVLGLGEATVRAGGGVLPTGESDLANPQTLLYYRGSAGSASPGTTKGGVGVLFGLMDATASVTAASSVTVEGVYDPTMQGQVAANLLGGTGSAFWGYSSRAALSAVSLGGDVHYESDPWASVDLTRATPLSVSMAGAGTSSLNAAFALAPPSLELTSLESNVYLEDHFGGGSALYLAPAPEGTLDLLAQGDLHLALGRIQMEDVYPSLAPGPLDAFALHGDSSGSVAILPNLWTMTGAPLHAGDPEPVHLYAVDGSVCAAHLGACTFTPTVGVQVLVPKPIEVVAGKDIVGGTYQPENNDPNDLSLFMAGRDIDQPVVNVMGEGATLLQAGRDLTLSQESSSGSNATPLGGAVYSLGNETAATVLTNSRSTPFPTDPGLSGSKGSDLYLMAGTANGAAWDAFAQAYLDPSNGQHVAKTYLAELASYLSGLDAAKYGALSPAELLAAFEALPLARRELFLDQVYFSELGQAGLDYNDPSSPGYHSYDRGFRAVSLLFPTDPASLSDAQRGNVVLSGKPVETQVDASIDILAPYGRVDVGAAIVPDSSGNSGGVVTRRGGDINVMADEDISLFTSRVFTLEGGNITMWTSNGSITAGTGSKTSVLQVPLEYTMDEEATLTVQAFGLQTGAGIGVLDALSNAASRPKNELDLIAPRGEVNAGDAGIRVVGDLNIAAEVVVGVENIQFTGNSAGVPKVELPSIGTLTSASQVATQATAATEPTPAEAAAAHKAALEELPSIITVEVVGYETTEAPEGPAGDADRGRKKGPPARP
ncbi:MAG TPA: filamentous hemagglutinin family protein, partial [Anaeromyxobacteraceae bacterium]|nr:filamentous hemagglutinin family protein [Anaeromyxobacteraceae bacterium]